MDALFGIFVMWLMASYGVQIAIRWKGDPGAFRNPGGFKFPAGEVLPFAGALVGLVLIASLAKIIF